MHFTKEKISRRNFLEIVGIGTLAGLAGCNETVRKILSTSTPLPETPTPVTNTPTLIPTPSATFTETETPTPEILTGIEIEKRILAGQIPILEYHYPGFNEAGVVMTEELFEAQMNFLKLNGFRTIKADEMTRFLSGSEIFPVKTVVLRIDQGGPAHFDQFEKMMTLIADKGFTAMIFMTSGEQFTDNQISELGKWHKQGLISIGSHSVTHVNFENLSSQQAYYEASNSKNAIEKRFADLGFSINVSSFSFPFDSVPGNADFLKSAGYSFGVGGQMYDINDNAAKPDQFILPSAYPYTTKRFIDVAKLNEEVNFAALLLNQNITFADLMLRSTSPVTPEIVAETTGRPCNPIYLGNFMEVPADKNYGKRIVRATGIVIHTDDQPGDQPWRWNSANTYNGLLGQDTDVHLGVGLDVVTQYLKMYANGFITPTRGAAGFNEFISIEMSGREFNRILDRYPDPQVKDVIEKITLKTIDLVGQIRKLCPWIDIRRDILGHYETSASGKTDPGEEYMNKYFRPLLLSSLTP